MKMTTKKCFIASILFIAIFGSLNAFHNSEEALRNLASPVAMRELISAPNTWYSQTAVIYSDPNYGGVPTTIMTGQPQPILSKYVSFQVGPSSTLRIVDKKNLYVYRFAPGTAKDRFEIDSSDWYATVDQPVAGDNCAMMFQYPRYHGYYQEFCVATDDGDYFYHEQLTCQFSSIVFGRYAATGAGGASGAATCGGASQAVALLLSSDRRSYLPLNRKRNFTGTYSQIYLFSSLDAQSAYLINTDINSVASVAQGYGNVAGQAWPSYDAGSYIFAAGANVYAKVSGQAVSFVVSGNRPFRYFKSAESLTMRVKDLYANPPAGNGLYTYDDSEGFSTAVENTYTGTTTTTYTTTNFRMVRFGSSIRGVYLYLNNNSHIYLGGGAVPSLNGRSISNIAVVPSLDDNSVFFFSHTDFLGTRTDLGTAGITTTDFSNSVNHFSLIVGRNVRRFGFYSTDNDANGQKVAVFGPGVYNTDMLGSGNWRISTDIYAYLSDFVNNDCVRVYIAEDLSEYSELCTNAPENYNAANLVNAQAVIFPKAKNFNTVLLYQSAEGANGNHLEMNLVGNTIFSSSVYNIFNRVTIVPNVPTGKIYLYSGLYYSGQRQVLSSGSYVYELDTTTTSSISTLFQGGSDATLKTFRLINATTRQVMTYTSNVKTISVQNMNVFMQAGEGTLVNGQTGAVWMFDKNEETGDEFFNMRVLAGREFFEGNMISSNVRYIYFPVDNSINRVYLFQGNENKVLFTNNASINTVTEGTAWERSVSLPSDWNSLLLFEGPNMNKYLCTLGSSVVVKLEKKTYSYVTSLTSRYRIYNFELIARNNFDLAEPEFTRAIQTIEPEDAASVNVQECGYYAFTREGQPPKSPVLDCIFVFEGCDYDPTKGFHKHCTKTHSYNSFDITIDPATTQLGVVISQPIEGKHHFRSYTGITIDGEPIDKTRCVTVTGPTVKAFFRR